MLFWILATVFLLPATVACCYYFLFTFLARRPTTVASVPPRHRFAILIPAHNEESGLALCLESITRADYPAELLSVAVVADNCTDRTAEVARQHNATVLERHNLDDRGKGYALAFGIERLLPQQPDALVILDADCEVHRNLFRVWDSQLSDGAEVVQCAVTTRNPDDSASSYATAIGAAIDNAVAAGKSRLGWGIVLLGTGMCFRRNVLERFPWTAFGVVEDAEYTQKLVEAGVPIRFEPSQLILSEAAGCSDDLYEQRRRWRFALRTGKTRFAGWLDSKPLVLGQFGITAIAIGSTAIADANGAASVLLPWVLLLGLLTGVVYIRALLHVGISWRRLGYLASIPAIVLRLAAISLVQPDPQNARWNRTRRVAEIAEPTR